MVRRRTRNHPPPKGPFPAPIGLLMGELRLGILLLNRDGLPVFANAQAERTLAGSARGALLSTLRAMTEGADSSGEIVEAKVPMGTGAARVLLVSTQEPKGFAACVDRDAEPALRAEIRMLRSMLETVAHSVAPRDVLGRTVETLAASFPEAQILLYEIDEPSRTLKCAFPGDLPPDLAGLGGTCPIDNSTAVGYAVKASMAVRVSRLARSPFAADRDVPNAGGLGSLVLPVGAQQRILGALRIVARCDLLGEGELRLLSAAADTVGALLERARQEHTLRAAREDAVRRERLAALGRLAAGVAHEVNNPLTFVSVNLALSGPMVERLSELASPAGASEAVRTSAELKEMLDESQQGIERLKTITQALQGVARDNSANRRPFDPAAAVRDAVHIFQAAKKSACRITLQLPPLRPVRGSPGELGQVILNLLDNGLHAMGNRGTLTVTAESRDTLVRIAVADTGPGIPAEIQPHVFEPFFTSKPFREGTGLGLYIGHEIVTQMNGTLSYETSGQGTTFFVDLPAL